MDAVQQEKDDYLNPRPSLLEVMNPSSASSPEAPKPRGHLALGSAFMIIIDWKIMQNEVFTRIRPESVVLIHMSHMFVESIAPNAKFIANC
jgi:hypothetical protein